MNPYQLITMFVLDEIMDDYEGRDHIADARSTATGLAVAL